MSDPRQKIERFAEHYVRDERDLADPFLRAIQRRFDEARFSRTYPAEAGGVNAREAKVFHIGKHIGKAMGKMNDFFDAIGPQQAEHAELVILHEVLPDTLIYRTQLANTLRFNMGRRLPNVKPEPQGIDGVYQLLGRARSFVDALDERSDHSQDVPALRGYVRNRAIPVLHQAGITLATHFGVDPQAIHLGRLVHHDDKPGML